MLGEYTLDSAMKTVMAINLGSDLIAQSSAMNQGPLMMNEGPPGKRVRRRERAPESNGSLEEELGDSLIDAVFKRPVIYDPRHLRYKSTEYKYSVWGVIAMETLGNDDYESVEKVKSRWKNLRDTYIKQQKKKKLLLQSNKVNNSKRKSWRYEKKLCFLDKYTPIKDNNLGVNDNEEETESDVVESSPNFYPMKHSPSEERIIEDVLSVIHDDDRSQHFLSQYPPTASIDCYRNNNNSTTAMDSFATTTTTAPTTNLTVQPNIDKMVDFANTAVEDQLNRFSSPQDEDDLKQDFLTDAETSQFFSGNVAKFLFPQTDHIDSFFKGIAHTVKNLKPLNQAIVKKAIANIVLDAEISEASEPGNENLIKKEIMTIRPPLNPLYSATDIELDSNTSTLQK